MLGTVAPSSLRFSEDRALGDESTSTTPRGLSPGRSADGEVDVSTIKVGLHVERQLRVAGLKLRLGWCW